MGQRFDFTPTLGVQNIEIPITNGLTSLHAEFTIDAPEDPPGRIVSIFGLRGNLTGNGRMKRRPLHFNFTQGQDHQARWEAEVSAQNPGGQSRGPQMPFPGTYNITIEWSAISGVASASIEGKGTFIIVGPSTQPITNGFLYIGGHVSKPPAPGELPVYTTPLGCNLRGFVQFNGEVDEDDGDVRGSFDDPDEPRPVDPLPPIAIPPIIQPPVIKPSPPVTTQPTTPTPTIPSNNKSDKVLGLERSDLILILRSILTSFERGEEIDLRGVLAQVLAPILIGELLGRR